MPAHRELILLRHAKAVEPEAEDFNRVLTQSGKAQAERMGRQLLRRGIKPDLVVSSPAARAWETAVTACREMGIAESAIVPDRAVYEADAAQLIQVIERHGGNARCLLLVGHNPGLSDLGAGLAKPLPDDWELVKGAAAVLAFEGKWDGVTKAGASVVAILKP